MKITPTSDWHSSDGVSHASRSAAVAAETLIQRKARMKTLFEADGAFNSEEIGLLCEKGDEIIEALTIKEKRGPRAAKQPELELPA